MSLLERPENFQKMRRGEEKATEVEYRGRVYAFSGTSPGKSSPCGAVL